MYPHQVQVGDLWNQQSLSDKDIHVYPLLQMEDVT